MRQITSSKTIAKNTIFLYFRTFLIMVISLFTSREILEALGETDFGIYNLVGSIVVLFSFLNAAMSSATQRFLNFELGEGNALGVQKVFSISVNIHLLIALIILLLGETLGLWFVCSELNIPKERLDAAIWTYQMSLVAGCLSVLRIPYNACIVAYERMSFYAYVSIVESLCKLSIVFLLYFSRSDKLIEYSFYMLSVVILINIVYMFYCKRNFESVCYIKVSDKVLFNKLISFSGWNVLSGVANTGVSQGINFLLNIFYSVALNAAMGLAHQVQSAFACFIYSFQTAFTPQIIKLYAAGMKTEFLNLVFRTSRLSFCLIFVLAIPIMFFIEPILDLWLTIIPEYTAGFVIIFIVYYMIDATSGPLIIAIQAIGDIKVYQIVFSFIVLLNIPIMLGLLYLGLSPILVVSIRVFLNLIAHIYRIFYLKKRIEFPVKQYLKDVISRITIMTIIGLLVFLILNNYPSTSLPMTITMFCFVLFSSLVIVWFVGMTKQERKSVKIAIKNRL